MIKNLATFILIDLEGIESSFLSGLLNKYAAANGIGRGVVLDYAEKV